MAARRFTVQDWQGTIVPVLERELDPARASAALAWAGEGTTGERVKRLREKATEKRNIRILRALDIALREVAAS